MARTTGLCESPPGLELTGAGDGVVVKQAVKRRHRFLYELGSDHEQSRTSDLMLCSRYQLVRKLGEGGMGSVWLAYDCVLDNREVALKLLPVDLLQNSHALWQQKNEARLSLRLSHPNIATTRAFEIDHGIPFLVMDYVPGVTLAQLLAKGGPITEAQAFELFAPLAEALDYAHSQGVIHRDIKPSNILISETGIPFLADFGIASEIRDAMKDKVSIAGTLPYMSPEQLLGNPPSESQDIYSFGATIYQCLVGHPPFYQGDITYQILHRDPAPLSCNCCFCTRTMFALAKVGWKRPAKANRLQTQQRGCSRLPVGL